MVSKRCFTLFALNAAWFMFSASVHGWTDPAELKSWDQRRDTRQTRRIAAPPWLEIEVLDPGVDPLGRPAVQVKPDADGGGMKIDIPPVVLVHRYYYTGDRDFQGPMLPGGPSIIVVNHPKTGERQYIPAQMLPGAPRVFYSAHGIEYDYGENGISLCFGLTGKPSVTYRSGRSAATKAKEITKKSVTAASQLVKETGLPEHLAATKQGIKNGAHSAALGIRKVGETVKMPIDNLVQRTPLGSVFSRSPEDLAAEMRDQAVTSVPGNQPFNTPSIKSLR